MRYPDGFPNLLIFLTGKIFTGALLVLLTILSGSCGLFVDYNYLYPPIVPGDNLVFNHDVRNADQSFSTENPIMKGYELFYRIYVTTPDIEIDNSLLKNLSFTDTQLLNILKNNSVSAHGGSYHRVFKDELTRPMFIVDKDDLASPFSVSLIDTDSVTRPSWIVSFVRVADPEYPIYRYITNSEIASPDFVRFTKTLSEYDKNYSDVPSSFESQSNSLAIAFYVYSYGLGDFPIFSDVVFLGKSVIN